jgi:hypothetical protein
MAPFVRPTRGVGSIFSERNTLGHFVPSESPRSENLVVGQFRLKLTHYRNFLCALSRSISPFYAPTSRRQVRVIGFRGARRPVH